ncbi:MAG: cellulase family glycosylhydrolase [Fibromonadales bacterium]|nr:cellulase family glycosylhydrolase [Fibromonadales bacterium]
MRKQLAFAVTILLSFAALSWGQQTSVQKWGKLQACSTHNICAEGGQVGVPLKGVSLGWSNTGWESAAFFNTATVNAMVDDWKAQIIRVPMGYARSGSGEFGGSYLDDRAGNMNRVKAAIDAAIANGAYVIIDWHSHSELGQADAITFFDEMARSYGKEPNVIFEIFNEPLNISWTTIKNYATPVIAKIREHSTNLILVGTPNWDQDIDVAASSPISGSNIAYVAHFYAASHPLSMFESKIRAVRNAGLSVFVSEFGTTHADGGCNPAGQYSECKNGNQYNSHSAANTNAWLSFLAANNIPAVAWNVNNKLEGSAFFGIEGAKSGVLPASYTNQDLMTASGKYIYNWLTRVEVAPQVTAIDDFANNNNIAKTGEEWIAFLVNKGATTATMGNPSILGTQDGRELYIRNGYAEITGVNLNIPDWGNWAQATIGLMAENNGITYDLAQCSDGFRYKYKGNAHRFSVGSKHNNLAVTHYADRGTAATDWATVEVKSFARDQYDEACDDSRKPYCDLPFDFSQIKEFHWSIRPSTPGQLTTGYLQIKDFECLGIMTLPSIIPPEAGDLAGAVVSNIPAQMWKQGDAPVEPAFTVTFDGLPLSESIDYTVDFIDNDKVGYATIILTGKEGSEFEGTTKEVTFLIIPWKEWVVIDDFADGDNFANTGESWSNFTVANGAATASITNLNKPVNANGYAEVAGVSLYISNWNPDWAQATIALATRNNGKTYDLARCESFSYEYIGNAHRLSLNSEYNGKQLTYYSDVNSNANAWTTVTKNSFVRDIYDAAYNTNPSIPLNLSEIKDIHWSVRPNSTEIPTTGYLQIRNFECYGALDLSNTPKTEEERCIAAGNEWDKAAVECKAERCKDDDGQPLYCRWDGGCFAMNTSNSSCEAIKANCIEGGSVYIKVPGTGLGDGMCAGGEWTGEGKTPPTPFEPELCLNDDDEQLYCQWAPYLADQGGCYKIETDKNNTTCAAARENCVNWGSQYVKVPNDGTGEGKQCVGEWTGLGKAPYSGKLWGANISEFSGLRAKVLNPAEGDGWWFGYTVGSADVQVKLDDDWADFTVDGASLTSNIGESKINEDGMYLKFTTSAGPQAQAVAGFNIKNPEGQNITGTNGLCVSYASDSPVALVLGWDQEKHGNNMPFYTLPAKPNGGEPIALIWNQFAQESGWGTVADAVTKATHEAVSLRLMVKSTEAQTTNFILTELGWDGSCNTPAPAIPFESELCLNEQEMQYYCRWGNGCYEIATEHAFTTCEAAVNNNCILYGSLYLNVPETGTGSNGKCEGGEWTGLGKGYFEGKLWGASLSDYPGLRVQVPNEDEGWWWSYSNNANVQIKVDGEWANFVEVPLVNEDNGQTRINDNGMYLKFTRWAQEWSAAFAAFHLDEKGLNIAGTEGLCLSYSSDGPITLILESTNSANSVRHELPKAENGTIEILNWSNAEANEEWTTVNAIKSATTLKLSKENTGSANFILTELGWGESCNTQAPNIEVICGSDIYVKGECKTPYIVTFSLNGGSGETVIENQTIADGSSIPATEKPETTGFTKVGFSGTDGKWYTDAEGKTEFVFGTSTITGATTLYLKWIPAEVVITTAAQLEGGTYGVAYTAQLAAQTSPDVGGEFTFALQGPSSPTGVEISASGLVSVTPEQAGDITFTVIVTCTESNASVEKQFTINIGKAAKTEAPLIANIVDPEITIESIDFSAMDPAIQVSFEGENSWNIRKFENLYPKTDHKFVFRYAETETHLASVVSEVKTVRTLDAFVVTFSLNDGEGTVPQFLVIEENNSVPVERKPSTTDFTRPGYINSSNGDWRTEAGEVFNFGSDLVVDDITLSLEWTAAEVVITTAAQLDDGTYGVAYTAQLAAKTDPNVGGNFTFALQGTSLPAGVAISASGLVSVTPAQLGDITFTVVATCVESGESSVEKQFTIRIDRATLTVADVEVPDLTAEYDPSKTLADISLPQGWSWNDATEIPTVAKTQYLASYLRDENHNILENVNVTVNVSRKPISVPTAIAGLVYDDSPKTGVEAGTGYILTGASATNANTYTAIATLDQNHMWLDGSIANEEIAWIIDRASQGAPDVTGVEFTARTSATITLPEIAGIEISIDGLNWFEGPKTFEELEPNTDYTFYFRKAGTANYKPSETYGELVFTTLKLFVVAFDFGNGDDVEFVPVAQGSTIADAIELAPSLESITKTGFIAGEWYCDCELDDEITESTTLSLKWTAAAVTISTESVLAAGTEGTAYTATISASTANNAGGAITYAVTVGTLPAGLSLNTTTGVISGTPIAVGLATFTVTATNGASGAVATKEFTISVGAVQGTVCTDGKVWDDEADECTTKTIGMTFATHSFGILRTGESFSIQGLTKAETVRIVDLKGKTLISRTVMPNESVSIAHLPKGMYLVNVNGKTLRMVK